MGRRFSGIDFIVGTVIVNENRKAFRFLWPSGWLKVRVGIEFALVLLQTGHHGE